MSRSRKKTPVVPITTATTEKEEKRDANRRLRRVIREKVRNGEEDLPGIRELSDVWNFSKDGKYRKVDEKNYRK